MELSTQVAVLEIMLEEVADDLKSLYEKREPGVKRLSNSIDVEITRTEELYRSLKKRLDKFRNAQPPGQSRPGL